MSEHHPCPQCGLCACAWWVCHPAYQLFHAIVAGGNQGRHPQQLLHWQFQSGWMTSGGYPLQFHWCKRHMSKQLQAHLVMCLFRGRWLSINYLLVICSKVILIKKVLAQFSCYFYTNTQSNWFVFSGFSKTGYSAVLCYTRRFRGTSHRLIQRPGGTQKPRDVLLY